MDEGINRTDAGEELEDVRLISAFLSGEKEAFDKLVLKYKDRVFNSCYRLLGDYEEANDCAQEVFVKVYRALKNFRSESRFSTWLYRIAANASKNRLASSEYRHARRAARIDDPRDDEDRASLVAEIRDDSLSPLRMLEEEEKERLIQSAIYSLPEEQRMVVVLRCVEGLSYEEVAKVTGHNIGTVKSKLARARERLRARLKGMV
jgi:RNA polymerase sigma-70 factor (ECF subfamily)